jgi:hypothetical protein
MTAIGARRGRGRGMGRIPEAAQPASGASSAGGGEDDASATFNVAEAHAFLDSRWADVLKALESGEATCHEPAKLVSAWTKPPVRQPRTVSVAACLYRSAIHARYDGWSSWTS